MELLTIRNLYPYAIPIFIAVHVITDIKKNTNSEPEGKWWLCLNFIRNYLSHNVEIDIPDLAVTVGRTMKNLYLLLGVDLTPKKAWKCTAEVTNSHYYWNDEAKNPLWVPYNKKNFDITEIFSKLKSVTYKELESGFKNDYNKNKDMVEIFIKCLRQFIVPLDTKWEFSFREKLGLLKETNEEEY